MSKNDEVQEEIDGLRKKAAMTDEALKCVKDSAEQLEMLKSEKDALERQAKAPLIKSLVKDSPNFAESDLEKLTYEALQALRTNFEDEVGRIYMDILEEGKEKDAVRLRRAHGTVGSYNQETKEFDQGVIV